jgi:heptosyltransferase-2
MQLGSKRKKVLIVKLGYSETLDKDVSRTTSLGDVLRTTVVLHHFKDDQVTWLVDEKAYPLLDGNPYIHRILNYDLSSVLQLQNERFDTVINFEKVPGLCALADSIRAWRRYGFRFDAETGEALAYDGCEQVFSLIRDPQKKRTHTTSWQQILMEMIGSRWKGQEYILGYRPRSKAVYDVGMNHMVGSKWPTKTWPEPYWKELARRVEEEGHSVSWQQGLADIYQYADWVNSCRALVTCDSLGLHIALALKKQVVVLYGPTNSNETYLYDRGVGIFPKGYDCLPCFSGVCDQEVHCMKTVKPEEVHRVFSNLVGQGSRETGAAVPA